LAERSLKLIFPCLSDSTGTTLKLAMCAVAGLVPWADTGIKQIFKFFY